MKKKTYRLFGLLLAIALVFGLTACGGTSEAASAASGEPGSASEATEPSVPADESEDTGEPSAESAEPAMEEPSAVDDAEEPAEPEEAEELELEPYTLPLTDAPVQYTWYLEQLPLFGVLCDSWDTNWAMAYLQETTGIDFEFIGSTETANTLQIMIAAGDYPDVMSDLVDKYAGSLSSAVSEGIIADLGEDIEANMPHYSAFLKEHPDVRKDTSTDDGEIWAIARCTVNEPIATGLVIRQDWLDQVNKDVPATIEELEDVLSAFASEIPTAVEGPMLVYNHGAVSAFGNSYTFSNSFNVGVEGTNSGNPFINQDGTVVYTPITDSYRNYLSVLQDWYQKGLIYFDFMSVGTRDNTTIFAQDKLGVLESGYASMMQLEGSSSTAKLVGMPAPTYNGEEIHLGFVGNCADLSQSVSISTQVENLELLMHFFDYLYTEEGNTICSYGVEGETFVYEDGTPVMTDFVYNNPDYNSTIVKVSTMLTRFPICYDCSIEFLDPNLSAEGIEATEIWAATTKNDWVMPKVMLTADESTLISSQRNDISTHVQEYTLKAITGENDLDATWDAYVAEVKAMDVDAITEAYQAALDRYENR